MERNLTVLSNISEITASPMPNNNESSSAQPAIIALTILGIAGISLMVCLYILERGDKSNVKPADPKKP